MIESTRPVDFGKTAADYSRYRAGFPDAFFERIAAFGVGGAGQRVLDIGTGTGTLARGFAKRGARATGLDKSDALLAEARRLDAESGVSVDYVIGTAEQTGQSAAAFDAVTAGQCWHWFDRPAAARECRRVLAPRGRLVIAHFDWVSLPGNVVDATMDVVLKYNPGVNPKILKSHGFYPAWLEDMAVAGFTDLETFSFDTVVNYSHEAWRGRLRACAFVGASLATDRVSELDADVSAMLSERFPQPILETPHRVFAIVGTAPKT